MLQLIVVFQLTGAMVFDVFRVVRVPIWDHSVCARHDVVLFYSTTKPVNVYTIEYVPANGTMLDILLGKSVRGEIRLSRIEAYVDDHFRDFLFMHNMHFGLKEWNTIPRRVLNNHEIKMNGPLFKVKKRMDDWNKENLFNLYLKNCKHFSHACIVNFLVNMDMDIV